MKNLAWFCAGIIISRWGIPVLWHLGYLLTIGILFLK